MFTFRSALPLTLAMLFAVARALAQSGPPERVVSEVRYSLVHLGSTGNVALLPQDSTRFSYRNGGHSSPNFYAYYQQLAYMTYSGSGVRAMAPDFLNQEPQPLSLDSADLPYVYFDTMRRYFTVARPLEHYADYVARYEPGGRFERVELFGPRQQGGFGLNARQVVAYTGGRMSRVDVVNYYSGAPDTASTRIITYDASGRILLDSLAGYSAAQPAVFAPLFRSVYTYNANGDFETKLSTAPDSSGVFDTVAFNVNTFYPDGRLETRQYHIPSLNPGAHVLRYAVDSVIYAPGTPGFVARYNKRYSPYDTAFVAASGWEAVRFNSQGLADSFVYFNMDEAGLRSLWGTSSVDFSPAGSPLRFSKWQLDQQFNGLPVTVFRWTYEPLPLGIPAGGQGIPQVRVAPNPSRGRLQLHYAADAAGLPVVISVRSLSGQMLRREYRRLDAGVTELNLQGSLTPGLYTILVQGADGAELCSGRVLMQ